MTFRRLGAFLTALSAIFILTAPRDASAQRLESREQTLWVEAESFADRGGWSLDTQAMDVMGSPYLLAHGIGVPVADAKTTLRFPKAGEYKVYARTRNWVAPWRPEETPGTFQIAVDGKKTETIFGTNGADWSWQAGGSVAIAEDKLEVEISLCDLTGFDGRVDALVFSADGFVPPEEIDAMKPLRLAARGLSAEYRTVENGKVYDLVVVGGGIAGTYAAKAAVGMGAQVTVIDVSLQRLTYLDDIFGAGVTTLFASERNIARALSEADLVVGTVLIPGGSTPKLIRREHLKTMKRGAVIVDVAVDQGGCCETSRVTYHDDPVFIEEGVVHYCVGNMPGAVPRTSTVALTNATQIYGLQIANLGLEEAARRNPALAKGVNYYDGKCVNANVARSLGVELVDLATLIG